MKAFLSLLAGLTTCIIAENCDPIAYEQSNPYGLSETKDPEVMKKLNKYLEDSEFFIAGLIEAGKILEKVLCPALKALDVVMAIGMAALPPPGRAITGGMVAAIRLAKAYKYAYEAQDAAQEWADFFLSGANFAGQAGCSPLVLSRDDLIKKVFTPLVDALDELVPGGMNYDDLLCPAKGCKGCKGPRCTRNGGNGDGDTTKASAKPAPTTAGDHPSSKSPPAETTVSLKTSSTFATSSLTASTISSPTSSTTPPVTTTTLVSTTLSSSSSAATSSLSCKDLAALDKDEVVDEASLLSRSYPIDLRYAGLEKRAKPKEGSACDYPLESFRYPSSGEWEADKPKKYGFNKRDSCDDYSMDKPDEGAGIQYDTEHVLEWQTVVQFFNTMGKEITTKFKNPDPQQNNMVGFCEYWRESWTWKDHRMDGPPASLANTPNSRPSPSPSASLSPSPSPNLSPTPGSSPKPDPAVMQRSPIGWLASVYPWKQDGDQMWLGEMPLLESEINARYKGRLFIQTLKKSGEYEDIVAERKMKALIKGRDKKLKLSVNDQSRRAIQKMRPMIGALKYMQQDSIAEIFANQKNRIGAMIGYIDRELQKTPRQFADATKPKSQEDVIDALPWQEQGLEKKWDAYMDNVFAVAKQRATDFMTVNLDRLKDEWESSKKTEVPKNFKGDAQAKRNEKNTLEKTQKDMLALIKKAQDEWDKVKDWAMPWKSKDEKDMDDDGADQ
ncbi:uncharacterized protein J4E78_003686 [Alternaria triticimaculans]|uniref:uncharacterized protein n=1 Tax=Alternaria triticimaculans TaxID=297637 RepID=UPI0020C3D8FF|nr:uncharacterized protein J4E78_003686 [Alternaria triticimaculans]KAI4663275.1 hypothetical protein J4E78_003686 [Alternaria triticimaculans]